MEVASGINVCWIHRIYVGLIILIERRFIFNYLTKVYPNVNLIF